jgi:hypothetical protein
LPGLVIRFPLHPSLKDLSGTGDVEEQLLQVNIFVPKLEVSLIIREKSQLDILHPLGGEG